MSDDKLEGFRLSPQQRRIWRDRRAQARATCEVELDGPLDRARLAQALCGPVVRHEILRTAFVALPGMELPLQVIQDIAEAAPEVHAAGAAGSPARVDRGPMIFARLHEVDERRHVLSLELPAL